MGALRWVLAEMRFLKLLSQEEKPRAGVPRRLGHEELVSGPPQQDVCSPRWLANHHLDVRYDGA